MGMWAVVTLFFVSAAASVSSSVSVSEWRMGLQLPAVPCDGFSCGALRQWPPPETGSCNLTMWLAVVFLSPMSGPFTPLLFLPARRGRAGLCQSLSVTSVEPLFGTRLSSHSVATVWDESQSDIIGQSVSVEFQGGGPDPSEYTLNISYICQGLFHYNVLDPDGTKIQNHLYRVDLTVLSLPDPVKIFNIDVVFPFANASIATSMTAPPVAQVSGNSTTFSFGAAHESLFNLAFEFSYQVYDPQCGQNFSVYIRYGLIGGAIVGAIAVLAAAAWFIVKKVIKRKVTSKFRVMGQDIDLLTDSDETDQEMEDAVRDV